MEPYDNNAIMYKIALMVHFKTSLLVLKLLYRTAFFPLNCFYFLAESDANTVMKHTLSNLCFSSVYQCLKKQFSIIHNTVVFCKTHSTCA